MVPYFSSLQRVGVKRGTWNGMEWNGMAEWNMEWNVNSKKFTYFSKKREKGTLNCSARALIQHTNVWRAVVEPVRRVSETSRR